ncbi:hypothetical protein TWF506_006989 [Arthrobotrys conoides]|uniref:Uncharacterized protein n=1 Tax=Arthrobotrys conoides TaxID=74498 RepID=A0AAN8S200_9PEZI
MTTFPNPEMASNESKSEPVASETTPSTSMPMEAQNNPVNPVSSKRRPKAPRRSERPPGVYTNYGANFALESILLLPVVLLEIGFYLRYFYMVEDIKVEITRNDRSRDLLLDGVFATLGYLSIVYVVAPRVGADVDELKSLSLISGLILLSHFLVYNFATFDPSSPPKYLDS